MSDLKSAPQVVLVASDKQPNYKYNQHQAHVMTLADVTPRSARAVTASANCLNVTSQNRSPIRSPVSCQFTTPSQRLRNPSCCSQHQRRTSVPSMSDFRDLPWPASATTTTMTNSSASGSIKNPSTLYQSTTSNKSSRGTPRSSLVDTSTLSPSVTSPRRDSDMYPKKPSTAEVFDLMEREQDAIVLKLIKEIAQLKEVNRALVNTINQLTNNSHVPRAKSHYLPYPDHPDHHNLHAPLDTKNKDPRYCD